METIEPKPWLVPSTRLRKPSQPGFTEARIFLRPLLADGRATLPTLTAIKVILYQGMRDQGIGKAELARRLGWHLPQVDRVLDVHHRSRLDRMDAALGAIGRHLEGERERRHLTDGVVTLGVGS